jgi:hypothetical protein
MGFTDKLIEKAWEQIEKVTKEKKVPGYRQIDL